MHEFDHAVECFYTLGADDRIVDCGGPGWGDFARANGAPYLAAAGLRGDSIYDHVAGHFTQRFLREFFVAARAATRPLTRAYRCDSPRVKRQMEMCACVEPGKRLRVEHRLVSEMAMAVEVAPQELWRQSRVEFSRCSICNRLKRLGLGDWREPDEAGVAGPLRVVHTVCQGCRSAISTDAPLRLASLE
jgi:hypothetical protein